MTVAHYIEKYIQTPPHKREDRHAYSEYLSNRTWNALVNWIAILFDTNRWKESFEKAEEIMKTKESLCEYLYQNNVDIYSMQWVGKKAIAEMTELFLNTLIPWK